MTYKIGNLELENRYFLAPMAEVNDIAFRMLCKKAGAGLTYTGMINPLSQEKLELDDKPAIQIFCVSGEGVSDFIKKYESQASLFDFNLGCPAKTAREHGYGCFMDHKLSEIESILKIMRESTKLPITVKLRKSKNTLKILKIAEKYCDVVCIHPRTSNQGYGGEPDIKFAERIKKKSKIPVIYSGNVNLNNYKELEKKFDFLMIGREAMGNPGIFSKLIGKNEKISFQDYLKLAGKYKLPYAQVKLHAMNFTKGMFGSREIRAKLVFAKTIRDIKDIYGI